MADAQWRRLAREVVWNPKAFLADVLSGLQPVNEESLATLPPVEQKRMSSTNGQSSEVSSMITPTSLRSLIKRLRDRLYEYDQANPYQDCRALIAEADEFLAQPESVILQWSDEKPPNENCPYNYCFAMTPFGRILLTWKGWKPRHDIAVTADETPFGEFFDCWNSVEEAKAQIQAEYNRRLAAATAKPEASNG
jgi:hypothetical protein